MTYSYSIAGNIIMGTVEPIFIWLLLKSNTSTI